MINLIHGDCLELMKNIPDNSIDSIVTDPPYGLGFMGKSWDKVLPPTEIWSECMRVLKPGGYIVAMSASRTYHRLAVQLEDLGMICHPMIGWIYGSGFPKATDLSKQFDKQAGAEREIVSTKKKLQSYGKANGADVNSVYGGGPDKSGLQNLTAPTTDNAKKWNGYKYGLQSLKPALEPIAIFQKPWKNKDVKRMTENVIKHGVGAFNIDACRVEAKDQKKLEKNWDRKTIRDIKGNSYGHGDGKSGELENIYSGSQGRHPANLLHDGSESVIASFPAAKGQQGNLKNNNSSDKTSNCYGQFNERQDFEKRIETDDNSSRFFSKLPYSELDAPFLYTAKPSKRERNSNDIVQNNHPTVKPIALMEWLIKLVTPEGGTTLDPFMGSGTNGVAAKKNGFNFIGIEIGDKYFEIAKTRINNHV